MKVLHGVDFVFKEINCRDASVNLSGSKQTTHTVSRCFVPNNFSLLGGHGRSRSVSREAAFSSNIIPLNTLNKTKLTRNGQKKMISDVRVKEQVEAKIL